MAKMSKLRWGILGAARIARKNWRAIRHSGNGQVVAVASRDPQRCRTFVADCQRHEPFETDPALFDRYEALLDSPEVDAVYIPLPTGLRKEWVIRAAESGKHVLSEKPCAVNLSDLRAMLATCSRNKVQFMDGVMFMHNLRLAKLRAALDDEETFGQIRRINSNFSFLGRQGFLDTNIRANAHLEPLGCLGDLGWYCIRFALWAMKWRLPVSVTGHILNSHSAREEQAEAPIEFSGELRFEGGPSAGFYCSFLAMGEQECNIIGTKACLEVPDYVLPFTNEEVSFVRRTISSNSDSCVWTLDNKAENIRTGYHGGNASQAQEALMFRNFAEQVGSGTLNDEWPRICLLTQQVTDACLKSARNGGAPVAMAG